MSPICDHLPLVVTALACGYGRTQRAATAGPSGTPGLSAGAAASAPPPPFRDVELRDDLGGVAGGEDPRRQAAPDDGPGRHDRVVTDLAARQHEHAVAEPDVPADGYRAGHVGVTGLNAMVIRIVDRAEIANEAIVADLYRLVRRNDNAL